MAQPDYADWRPLVADCCQPRLLNPHRSTRCDKKNLDIRVVRANKTPALAVAAPKAHRFCQPTLPDTDGNPVRTKLRGQEIESIC